MCGGYCLCCFQWMFAMFFTTTGKVIASLKWHVICLSASHFVSKFTEAADVCLMNWSQLFKENFVVSRALIPPNLGNNWVDSGYLRLMSIPPKKNPVVRAKSISPLLTCLSKMKAKICPLNYRYICWWETCLGLLQDRGSKIFMFWKVCILVGESWFWLLCCCVSSEMEFT